MACTVDLVTPDKRRMLQFSAVVWSRAWFLWAPFIFILKKYDAVLPLTVFATLVVIGGGLMALVNYSHDETVKKTTNKETSVHHNICTITDGKIANWITDDEKRGTYIEHPQAI